MKAVARWMSRNPWTWRAWMSLGTPIVISTFLLTMAIDLAIHLHATWHYEWRDQWAEWFRAFTEKHRLRLHSLGLKPEPGGTLMKKENVANRVVLFEDLGYGREFTPTHVRHAEDLN